MNITVEYRCEVCGLYTRSSDGFWYSFDGVTWVKEVPTKACNWHQQGPTFDYFSYDLGDTK